MTVKELRDLLSNYHNDELVGIGTPGIGINVHALVAVTERPIAWRNELGSLRSRPWRNERDGVVSAEYGVYSVILCK